MTDHKTSAKPNSFDGSRSKLKLKWIEKGACPGWTTDLLQDDAVAK